MSDLFFAADTVDSGAAHNLSVQLCEKLDLIGAVCFRLQKIRFLLSRIAMFFGVSKKKIRLRVRPPPFRFGACRLCRLSG